MPLSSILIRQTNPRTLRRHVTERERAVVYSLSKVSAITQPEISRALNILQYTVSRVLSQPIILKRLQRQTTLLDILTRRYIASEARNNSVRRRQAWHQIAKEIGIVALRWKIDQSIKLEGLGRFYPAVTLYTNVRIRTERVQFVRYQLNFDWERFAICSDEIAARTRFTKIHVIRLARDINNKYYPDAIEPRGLYIETLYFYSAISAAGPSALTELDRDVIGNQTAANYIEYVLPYIREFLDRLPNTENLVLFEDNALCYKARLTKQAYAELGIRVVSFPPYSPDLNLIENIQGIIKLHLARRYPQPRTEAELRRDIRYTQNYLVPGYVANVMRSMRRRLQMVIDFNGYPVDYQSILIRLDQ